MQRIADYKILNKSVIHIASNSNHSIDFNIKGAVVTTDDAQGPFLMFSEELGGALPGTITVSLNGTEINVRSGSQNNLLSGGYSYSHMVAFDGNLLNVGSNNTLTVDVSTTTNTSLDLGLVVLHFQRKIE